MAPNPINEWLTALGMLSSGNTGEDESSSKRAAYASMLRDEFDIRAFTHGSLAFVARRSKWGFPKYGEICEYLAEWWKDNRPTEALRLTGTPEDKWRDQMRAEREEAERDWADPANVRRSLSLLTDHPMQDHLGKMLGALVMRHAPGNCMLLPDQYRPPEAEERLRQMHARAYARMEE